MSNYRLESLLPIMSKILEIIVARQLSDYLETNKLLSNSQHGFRSKLLIVISDKIYENTDNKNISMLTLCDLLKAFDSVNLQLF